MPWTSNESVSLPAFTVALGLLTVSIFSKWPRWSFFEPVPILRSFLRSCLHRPLWAEVEVESTGLPHIASFASYHHHPPHRLPPSICRYPFHHHRPPRRTGADPRRLDMLSPSWWHQAPPEKHQHRRREWGKLRSKERSMLLQSCRGMLSPDPCSNTFLPPPAHLLTPHESRSTLHLAR